jgi:cobalt-zinc-cadmium efflux system outer membrane protein
MKEFFLPLQTARERADFSPRAIWHAACLRGRAVQVFDSLCSLSAWDAAERRARLGHLGAPRSGTAVPVFPGARYWASAVLLAALGTARLVHAEPADRPAEAGRAPARVLLRDEARLRAWLERHSPELAAARARAAQATADLGTARLIPNPVLDASLSNIALGTTNPPGLSFDQYAIYGVGLSETVELGKRGPRAAAASLRAESAHLQTLASSSERLSAARAALGLAVHLGARLAILDESRKAAEHGAELERTRFEQKALSGMDYDRLLLDLASLEAEFTRNQAEFDSALASCGALLAASCDLSGATEDDLNSAVPLAALPATDARLLERPDLRSLDMDRQAAERDAALARARAIPDVTVRLGYTHDRFVVSGDNRNTLAVSLQLPLPVFDRGQHDAAKALSHAEELSASKAALLASSHAEVAGLLNRKAALEKSLAVLEQDTLPRSRGVLDSAQHAFDIGGISLTDLLLSRRSHIALELNRLDQRFELFSVRNELTHLLALETDASQPSSR